MKCSILIADDERLARDAIRHHLPAHIAIEVVAECSNGEEALKNIVAFLPDIIFLDIKMPSLTGFEVLRSLPPNYAPNLIIVTAYDSFALEAFDNNAIDYLLKPFSKERFDKAFQKCYERWETNYIHKSISSLQSFTERMKHLFPADYHNVIPISRIAVKDGGKIYFVLLDEIQFAEADKDYTTLHTAGKKYLYNQSLAALEKILPHDKFSRIHRSYIVNIAFIKELSTHHNGDYTVVLKTGYLLKLSRNYRDKLLSLVS